MAERKEFSLPDMTTTAIYDVWFPPDRYYQQSPIAHDIRNAALRVLDIAATKLYWAGPLEHIEPYEELDTQFVTALYELRDLGVQREFNEDQHIPTPADTPEYTAKFYATHLIQLCELGFPNVRAFLPDIILQFGKQLDKERQMYTFTHDDLPRITRAYNKMTQEADDTISREFGLFVSQSNALAALCRFFDTKPLLPGRPLPIND